jgi:hypothetical protein
MPISFFFRHFPSQLGGETKYITLFKSWQKFQLLSFTGAGLERATLWKGFLWSSRRLSSTDLACEVVERKTANHLRVPSLRSLFDSVQLVKSIVRFHHYIPRGSARSERCSSICSICVTSRPGIHFQAGFTLWTDVLLDFQHALRWWFISTLSSQVQFKSLISFDAVKYRWIFLAIYGDRPTPKRRFNLLQPWEFLNQSCLFELFLGKKNRAFVIPDWFWILIPLRRRQPISINRQRQLEPPTEVVYMSMHPLALVSKGRWKTVIETATTRLKCLLYSFFSAFSGGSNLSQTSGRNKVHNSGEVVTSFLWLVSDRGR